MALLRTVSDKCPVLYCVFVADVFIYECFQHFRGPWLGHCFLKPSLSRWVSNDKNKDSSPTEGGLEFKPLVSGLFFELFPSGFPEEGEFLHSQDRVWVTRWRHHHCHGVCPLSSRQPSTWRLPVRRRLVRPMPVYWLCRSSRPGILTFPSLRTLHTDSRRCCCQYSSLLSR